MGKKQFDVYGLKFAGDKTEDGYSPGSISQREKHL